MRAEETTREERGFRRGRAAPRPGVSQQPVLEIGPALSSNTVEESEAHKSLYSQVRRELAQGRGAGTTDSKGHGRNILRDSI